MRVIEMSSVENNKNITINFNYNEIRDIINALYYASKELDNSDKNYNCLHTQMKVMFDLVKCGNIQPETIERLCKGER